jgi:hypothetical protein
VAFTDNLPLVSLIEAPRGGIFAVLDEVWGVHLLSVWVLTSFSEMVVRLDRQKDIPRRDRWV